MNYFVYILKCSDNSYYTGVTSDFEKRIYEHQNGLIADCYTLSRRPVVLALLEEFSDIRDAIDREKQIKRWSRKKKEALIAKDFEKLKYYSKNSVVRQAHHDKQAQDDNQIIC